MAVMLSVGAGKEQVHAIRCAKRLGLRVVALDANPSAPGFEYADESIGVDIKDKERVIEVARRYGIRGVLPSPIGRYLTTIGAVNDALNLPGISEEAARRCADKVMTHRVMSDNGVPCARQRTARDLPGIIRAVREIGPPCVLKPQYGSGSKGVVVIRTEEEAEDLARLHLEHRAGDEDSLVEELLGGEEYGIDGVVIDGRFRLILARKKIITRYPYRQELGYLAPDEPADGRFAVIGGMMQAAVAAAGLDHCLVNADVLVDGDKAWLIEITGRPAGQMTTEFMVPFVTGVDPIVEFIRHQNGMDGDFAVKQARPMVFHFLAVPPGRVVSVPDREAIVRNPNVLRYASDITPGDVLAEIRNGVDAYARGYVATTGESVGHALREAVAVIHQFGVAQGG